MVTRLTAVVRRWGLPVLVGLIAFVAAYLALLPGVDFWDTGELQTVRHSHRHRHRTPPA